MPVPQQDVSSWHTLTMKIFSYQQSWSEHYFMKLGTFDANEPGARCLALWRAAILGRDCRLDYAVLIQKGPARTSRVVVESPIQGTTGVKFDTTTTAVGAVNVNTPGDCLQVRMETAGNHHADRAIKGILDGWINRKKYIPQANPEDVLDFGNYTAVMDPAADVPQSTALFEFAPVTPYTSAQLAKFVNYETAMKKFFQAVYNFTTSRYPELTGSPLAPTGNFVTDNWRKFIYRYSSSRTVGDPF